MINTLKKTTAIAALAALFAPASFAGPCGNTGEPTCPGDDGAYVLNNQIQFGDVFSNMDVVMPDGGTDAVSSAAAYGNVSSALTKTGTVTSTTTQEMTGNAGARAVVNSGPLSGSAIATSAVYGNSNLVGTWDGAANNRATQTMSGDVTSESFAYVTSARDIAVSSAGAANVSAVESENGTIRNFVEQTATGSIRAQSITEACCSGNSAQVVSTALGNSTSSTGYTATSYTGAVQTTGAGETISAYSGFRSPVANNVTLGASTAAGNSAVVHNQWGYATLGREGSELYQEQQSRIEATTYVNIDSWTGVASASAYGVGNSALISNIGSDTSLYAVQNNLGEVTTNANLIGQSYSGGTGFVTSTAIGNAASAYVCTTCGDATVGGSVYQFNGADITARGTAWTPVAGSVVGASVAIGNSATFQATQSSGAGD